MGKAFKRIQTKYREKGKKKRNGNSEEADSKTKAKFVSVERA